MPLARMPYASRMSLDQTQGAASDECPGADAQRSRFARSRARQAASRSLTDPDAGQAPIGAYGSATLRGFPSHKTISVSGTSIGLGASQSPPVTRTKSVVLLHAKKWKIGHPTLAVTTIMTPNYFLRRHFFLH